MRGHSRRARRLFMGLVIALAAGTAVAGVAVAHGGREVGPYLIVVGFEHEPPVAGEPNAVFVRITRTKPPEDHAMDHGPTVVAPVPANAAAHGALVNEVLAPGAAYVYEFGQNLVGATIPFHTHPGDFHVDVTISGEASGPPAIDLSLGDSREHGAISVRPGTTARFFNSGTGTVVLMSGVTDETRQPDVGPVTGLADRLRVEVIHLDGRFREVMSFAEVAGAQGEYVARFVPGAGSYEFRLFGEIEGMAINESFRSGRGSFEDVQDADTGPPWLLLGGVAGGIAATVVAVGIGLSLAGRKETDRRKKRSGRGGS